MNYEFGRINNHTKEIEKIYKQRRYWLYASSVVYTSIIFLIFGWDYLDRLHNNNIWWSIISLGLLISINWWYWTMRSLSTLVRSVYAEFEILSEITDDISEIKIIMKCKQGTTKNCNICPVVNGCADNKK